MYIYSKQIPPFGCRLSRDDRGGPLHSAVALLGALCHVERSRDIYDNKKAPQKCGADIKTQKH